MRVIDTFLAEMEQEAKTTKKFLEALQADKMDYKPHEKSMTCGSLAMHVATLPGHLAEWIKGDEFDMSGGEPDHGKVTKEAILAAFEKSMTQAREIIGGMDDHKANGVWHFKMSGKELFAMPRVQFVRFWICNHLYHHRGQLGVYLRLTGAKVPASYGPSADENPMAAMMEPAAGRA